MRKIVTKVNEMVQNNKLLKLIIKINFCLFTQIFLKFLDMYSINILLEKYELNLLF